MKKILFAVWAFIVCLNLQADPISAERARTIAARFAANADSPHIQKYPGISQQQESILLPSYSSS